MRGFNDWMYFLVVVFSVGILAALAFPRSDTLFNNPANKYLVIIIFFTVIICALGLAGIFIRLQLREEVKKNKERGSSSVEYALIVGAMVVIIIGLVKFGPAVKSLFDSVSAVWPK